MQDGEKEQDNQAQPLDQEKTAPRRPILSLELPPDRAVLAEARMLVADKNTRTTTLARLIAQDPVTALALIRVANATFFSADRPAITNIQTAVVRLGSQTIIELLDSLAQRADLPSEEEMQAFESLRTLSRQSSLVARIIAQMTHNEIAELAQVAGLFSYMGHLLACAFLGSAYAEESKARKNTALIYHLAQYFRLDLNAIRVEYLRKNGLPHVFFYAFDRELKCKNNTQSALRFIVESSVEMVEAYKDKRWDKYEPGKPLPAKSALRLLQMNEMQYEHIFDTIDSYLGSSEGQSDEERIEELEREEEIPEIAVSDEAVVEEALEKPEEEADDVIARQRTSTLILRRDGFPHRLKNAAEVAELQQKTFGTFDPAAQPTNFIENNEEELDEEQKSLSPDGQKVLDLIANLCKQAGNAQGLLVKIMKLLINEGPFVRAALIVLQSDRLGAEIHTAVGEGFVENESITVRDPLSPLALCLTKIKSFNVKNYQDLLSPFGVSAYAVSPIKVKHDAPVVLYADCGLDKPLPMDARKVFRLVVGLLNQTLPRMSGGLPKKAVRKPGDTAVFENVTYDGKADL